jgi:hypothetical protein
VRTHEVAILFWPFWHFSFGVRLFPVLLLAPCRWQYRFIRMLFPATPPRRNASVM